jgi:hypothetical protein
VEVPGAPPSTLYVYLGTLEAIYTLILVVVVGGGGGGVVVSKTGDKPWISLCTSTPP